MRTPRQVGARVNMDRTERNWLSMAAVGDGWKRNPEGPAERESRTSGVRSVHARVSRPHFRMMGRAIRFSLSELEKWRQKFFVNGGIDEQDRKTA
jgi:hypothetical protein